METRTIAILPMKRFGTAKSRLAAALGTGARQALAQAMFSDVLAALRRVERLDAIAVITADREVVASLHGEGVTLLPDEQESGQSAATLIGVKEALVAGFDRVLLVPGDAPLLDPVAVNALLEGATGSPELVIVPDRHLTGTNALLISPPDALEPSFGPGSLARHEAAAAAAGLSYRVDRIESLMLDIDTPEDLGTLIGVLAQRRALAPRTRGALAQLERVPGTGIAEIAATARESQA